MIINCGHTICESCLDLCPRCPICSQAYTSKTNNIILSQIIERYVKTHEVNPADNPESKAPEVPTVCTFSTHGRNFIRQKWYSCDTCSLTNGTGCCEACAKRCHAGHRVRYIGIHDACYCDCGAGSRCKLLHPADTLPSDPDVIRESEPESEVMQPQRPTQSCTRAMAGEVFIRQPWYHCHTCNLNGSRGCCEVCAKTCHAGHLIENMGIHRSCFCDCGTHGSHCRCTNVQPETECKCESSDPHLRFKCRSCGGGSFCRYCASNVHRSHPITAEEYIVPFY